MINKTLGTSESNVATPSFGSGIFKKWDFYFEKNAKNFDILKINCPKIPKGHFFLKKILLFSRIGSYLPEHIVEFFPEMPELKKEYFMKFLLYMICFQGKLFVSSELYFKMCS